MKQDRRALIVIPEELLKVQIDCCTGNGCYCMLGLVVFNFIDKLKIGTTMPRHVQLVQTYKLHVICCIYSHLHFSLHPALTTCSIIGIQNLS